MNGKDLSPHTVTNATQCIVVCIVYKIQHGPVTITGLFYNFVEYLSKLADHLQW